MEIKLKIIIQIFPILSIIYHKGIEKKINFNSYYDDKNRSNSFLQIFSTYFWNSRAFIHYVINILLLFSGLKYKIYSALPVVCSILPYNVTMTMEKVLGFTYPSLSNRVYIGWVNMRLVNSSFQYQHIKT